MDGERKRRDRARSLVIGGLLGASAVFATGKRQRRRQRRATPTGLAAFESAPCYRELLDSECEDEPHGPGSSAPG